MERSKITIQEMLKSIQSENENYYEIMLFDYVKNPVTDEYFYTAPGVVLNKRGLKYFQSIMDYKILECKLNKSEQDKMRNNYIQNNYETGSLDFSKKYIIVIYEKNKLTDIIRTFCKTIDDIENHPSFINKKMYTSTYWKMKVHAC